MTNKNEASACCYQKLDSKYLISNHSQIHACYLEKTQVLPFQLYSARRSHQHPRIVSSRKHVPVINYFSHLIARSFFLIPAESGEKITLGISTMLNMTVFLMTVTSGIPPTDQTPILSKSTHQ